MNLAAVQAALVSAATGRDAPDAALLACVRAHRNASADERLDAYRANIKGAHLQALDQAYPVLREVLGPRYWRQLLEAKLPVYASSSPDLNAYGDFMPELLREAQRQRPELRDLPYLEALATLEWQVHRARFAADDAVFDWDAFASLPEDVQASARLLRSNALALLQLDYPVDAIWISHNGLDAGEDDDAGDSYCCVHRAGRFHNTYRRTCRRRHRRTRAADLRLDPARLDHGLRGRYLDVRPRRPQSPVPILPRAL
jgi:hypothetical protein